MKLSGIEAQQTHQDLCFSLLSASSPSMGKNNGKNNGAPRKIVGKQKPVKAETPAETHKRQLSNLLTCMNRDASAGIDGAAEAKERYSGLRPTPERIFRAVSSHFGAGRKQKMELCA